MNTNRKSSLVKGAPSDHLMPARSFKVIARPSSLTAQVSARLGRNERMSAEIESGASTFGNVSHSVKVMRAVPP